MDRLEEMVVGLPLVLKGEATIGDMIEVLQPLEVRDSDTTSVDVEIGDNQDIAVLKNLVASGGDGAVGSLGNNLGLDLVGVALVDDFLNGGGDEDVTGLVQQILALVGGGGGEAHDGSVLQLVFLQCLGVNTVGVVDLAVDLLDTDAHSTGTVQVPHGVQAHVTEALNDEGLAAPAGGGADEGHVGGLVDEVLEAVEHPATCGGRTPVDATLVDGLASHARVGVDVVVTNGIGICICYPGHLSFTSTHIRSRDVKV